MSLEDIKNEMANMPQQHQDQLAAYLVHLRHPQTYSLHRLWRKLSEAMNTPRVGESILGRRAYEGCQGGRSFSYKFFLS